MQSKPVYRPGTQTLLGDAIVRLWAWNNVPTHHLYPDGSMKIDAHGKWIRQADYGQRTQYGWQIDHYPIPQAKGGKDTPDNVRALHHENNARLGGLLGALLGRD